MARQRKTIPVDEVKNLINDMLNNSDDDRGEGRIALAVALERILHTTGNYRGFRYTADTLLPKAEMIKQHIPFDETRRYYY